MLTVAGLMIGQAAVTGVATAAASDAGKRKLTAATTTSLNVNISGVDKARVKVKGNGIKRVVRSSTVLRLPEGTYRVRAFRVLSDGTVYSPKHRRFRLSAKGGTSVIVAVHYDEDTTPAAADKRVPASPIPDGDIATMVSLVNEARSRTQQCGSKSMPPAPPVLYNADIAEAAQAHAEDMAAKNYFEHTSLDGRSFVDRIRATDYSGSAAGENIASGFRTAQDTLQGWLKSPGHCVNLMDPDFDHMGLGFAERMEPKYTLSITYWVQDFGYDRSSY